jgi:septal ring factor EnvC (AmiA/AmiB activator)
MMYLRRLSLLVLMLFVGGCNHHKLVDCQNQNQKLNADLAQVQQRLQDETANHKADVDKLNEELAKMQIHTKEITTNLKQSQQEQYKLRAVIGELELKVKAQSEENEELKSSLAEMEKKATTEPPAPPEK